jgi:hypothetical protein
VLPFVNISYNLATGDAGFGSSLQTCVPNRGERYHLKDFGNQQGCVFPLPTVGGLVPSINGTVRILAPSPRVSKPQNKRELFNLWHSQQRIIIEQCFGEVKRRFPVRKYGCEADLEFQCQLISALCCLHNFIRIHEKDAASVLDGIVNEDRLLGEPTDEAEDDMSFIANDAIQRAHSYHGHSIAARRKAGNELREQIEDASWTLYQKHLREGTPLPKYKNRNRYSPY